MGLEEFAEMTDDEKLECIRVQEVEIERLRHLLKSIPECPEHGDECIPHAEAWINKHKVDSMWVVEVAHSTQELLFYDEGEARKWVKEINLGFKGGTWHKMVDEESEGYMAGGMFRAMLRQRKIKDA